MEFTKETLEALNRYFTTLSAIGYKDYCSVTKLLIMSFLEELLTGYMAPLITEEDYHTIMNSINCLYGSCLIPYQLYERTVVNINKTIE